MKDICKSSFMVVCTPRCPRLTLNRNSRYNEWELFKRRTEEGESQFKWTLNFSTEKWFIQLRRLNFEKWFWLQSHKLFFKNGPTPFIFFLFKQKIYRKTVGVSGIRTRMVGKSQHIIATLQFDILALWLDVASHMTSLYQPIILLYLWES